MLGGEIIKRVIAILCSCLCIASTFAACSLNTVEMQSGQSLKISKLKYGSSDVECAECGKTDNVCVLNYSDGESDESLQIGICKDCANTDCVYCGENKAEYVVLSLIGYPLLLCDDCLTEASQQNF